MPNEGTHGGGDAEAEATKDARNMARARGRYRSSGSVCGRRQAWCINMAKTRQFACSFFGRCEFVLKDLQALEERKPGVGFFFFLFMSTKNLQPFNEKRQRKPRNDHNVVTGTRTGNNRVR